MQIDLSLRLAAPADARCIGVLGAQVFLEAYAPQGIRPLIADEVLEHFSTGAITRLLADSASTFILAESAGHLIAFAQLTRGAIPPCDEITDGVELVRLYVLERFTRGGIGKRLLREAESWSASTPASMLWLTAWIGNHRALAFYAAQGYAEAGTTPCDFQGELFENRIFSKSLRPR